MKIVIVPRENLVGEEFGKIIIDEILGFSLAEERDVRFVDDKIEEVDIGASGELVQDALALGKSQGAGFELGEMAAVALKGNTLLLFAHDALNALGALVRLKNGRGEDKIAPTAAKVAGFVDENFNHGAIIAVLKIITKHKRDG